MVTVALEMHVPTFVARCREWRGTPAFSTMLQNAVLLSVILDGENALVLGHLMVELGVSESLLQDWLVGATIPCAADGQRAALEIATCLEAQYGELQCCNPEFIERYDRAMLAVGKAVN